MIVVVQYGCGGSRWLCVVLDGCVWLWWVCMITVVMGGCGGSVWFGWFCIIVVIMCDCGGSRWLRVVMVVLYDNGGSVWLWWFCMVVFTLVSLKSFTCVLSVVVLHKKSYQNMYRLVAVQTHSDFIVMPHWESRPPIP